MTAAFGEPGGEVSSAKVSIYEQVTNFSPWNGLIILRRRALHFVKWGCAWGILTIMIDLHSWMKDVHAPRTRRHQDLNGYKMNPTMGTKRGSLGVPLKQCSSVLKTGEDHCDAPLHTHPILAQSRYQYLHRVSRPI
jgi:hypothetical protein